MKNLYLMRHGQTIFNQLKKVQGWCDSPLTEKGIKQAEIAGSYFRDNQIKFDSAYSSTAERACDTLELVTDIPYKRVKGLKEWNFGLFEAQDEHLNPALPYGDFFVRYGGEDEIEFRKRVSDTILNLMKEETGKTVLMVSHGASCRQFMLNWAHKSDVNQKERLSNCCILKFEYKNEEFILKKIINHTFPEIK